MKKTAVSLLFFFLALTLSAAVFPSYDFTFYKTADETLTSFTKENVGIDVTGYGFVGEHARSGIYVRIGLQTPFETLVRLKNSLFSRKKENIDSDTVFPQTTASLVAPADADSPPIGIEPSHSDVTSQAKKKKDEIDPSEWKFLLTLGPAWRNMMDENAMVYAGFGLSVSTDYINDFTYENGDYYASFSAVFGTDMDAGFRIGLSNSSTTIRIGVHFITSLVGYSALKVYDKDRIVISSENYLYGYIAGKKGIATAMTGRGYIRLAKTLNDKRTIRYNYSNTTSKVGAGTVKTIVL